MISQSQPQPAPRAPSGHADPIRVLLIDDEPDQTDLLKAGLEQMGSFEVHCSNSPIMGLETARTLRPDIIILDICMPILDGGDVLASMQLDPDLRDIDVIFCSSLVSNDEMSEDGFVFSDGRVIIAKPVRVDKLVSCIQRRLAGQL